MRQIGLHIRFESSIIDAAHKAAAHAVPIFQCFLINKEHDRIIKPTAQERRDFIAARQQFQAAYVHGSYWINPAGTTHSGGCGALERELRLAKKLEFSHMVLHPGCAKGFGNKLEGINMLARILNKILKKESDITIVLENVAHSAFSIGGDVRDFSVLLERLNQPDKIRFCIDTAHTHSYGYDIIDAHKREQFIQEIDANVGLQRVALIHVNDTSEQLGSKIDKHQIIGQGLIGLEVLKAFVMHPKLVHTALLLEPPVVTFEQEHDMLQMVRAWQ